MLRNSLKLWMILGCSLLLPLALVGIGAGFFVGENDLAQGRQSQIWTTSTLGQAGAKGGSWWFTSDVALSERDAAGADDDALYVVSTALLGSDWFVLLHVSKDGGRTWTKYILKQAGDVVIVPHIDAAGYRDGDVICVAWQDWEAGSGVSEIVAQCFWAPKATVAGLPNNPAGMPNSGALAPAAPLPANDPYTPDPQPQQVLPLGAGATNVSNSRNDPSGNHDFPGAGEYVGSWDLALNAHPQCAANGFPLVIIAWAENFSNLVYAVSNDGQKWQAAQPSSFPDETTRFPSLYVDANGVIYLSSTQVAEKPDVLTAASADCGKTWGQPENTSKNQGFSDGPYVAVTPDGKLHIVSDDDTTNSDWADIHYNQCTRNGNTVSCTGGSKAIAKFGGFPYIATDGKQALYVAYSSAPGGKSGGIGFTCSVDGGSNWKPQEDLPNSTIGAPSVRFSDLGVHHWQVKLAVNAANTVYMVWTQWIRTAPTAIRLQFSKRNGC